MCCRLKDFQIYTADKGNIKAFIAPNILTEAINSGIKTNI
jgi:hypothetical protein